MTVAVASEALHHSTATGRSRASSTRRRRATGTEPENVPHPVAIPLAITQAERVTIVCWVARPWLVPVFDSRSLELRSQCLLGRARFAAHRIEPHVDEDGDGSGGQCVDETTHRQALVARAVDAPRHWPMIAADLFRRQMAAGVVRKDPLSAIRLGHHEPCILSVHRTPSMNHRATTTEADRCRRPSTAYT
jgi:hypothetical protein